MKQTLMTWKNPRMVTVRLTSLALVALMAGCESHREASTPVGITETASAVDVAWIEYPEARRGDDVDVYHGVEVPDPYRWMEDEAAAETQAWLSKQDGIAERFFGELGDREAIADYMESHWLDGVVAVPVRKGDRTFLWKAAEGKSHNVLYVRKGDGEPEAIFDLNERNPGEKVSTRTTLYPSPEGRFVGYLIHRAGADAAEIRFYDTEDGRELDDFIPAAHTFVTAWLPDESGFLYTWVDMPTILGQGSDKEPGVYLHTVGTSLDKDKLVYRRPWEGQFMAAAFLRPQSVYAYDTTEKTLTVIEAVETPPELDSYEVARVFYDSFDGTRIPMTILRPAATPRDGRSRTLLYGYGGWGISLLPRFNNRIHAWLHMGGTYAIATLRGGGEYGDAWHKAGQFMNKQDVFKDFYAAAEHLVNEKYTSPSRLTILGGSNGGLLTAAAYNQRPELFGAVVSKIAVVDMLRIQDTPTGATATMELGHPNESQEMFEYLRSYSPLHNVRHEGPYPPILHMVGENDPRCKPGHIYKYVAEMQRGNDARRVAILRLVRGAGHGSGRKDDLKRWYIDELAFAWAMTEVR